MALKFPSCKGAILTAFCLYLLLVLSLGLVVAHHYVALCQKRIFEQLEYTTKVQKISIDNFFDKRTAELVLVGNTESYSSLIKPGKMAEVLTALQKNSPSIVGIGIINATGQYVAHSSWHESQSAVLHDNNFWFDEMADAPLYISDIAHYGSAAPSIILACKFTDKDRVWLIRATVDANALLKLLEENITINRSENLFFINRKKEVQALGSPGELVAGLMDVATRDNLVPVTKKTMVGQQWFVSKMKLDTVPWSLVMVEGATEYSKAVTKIYVLALCGIFFLIVPAFLLMFGNTRFYRRQVTALTKEIHEYSNKLLQLNKVTILGRLTASVAHEVNNPLMLIQETAGWISDMMEDETPETMSHYKEILTAAGNIERHVKRASKVTHGFLGFMRTSNNFLDKLSLSLIIDQAIMFLQTKITWQGVILQKEYAPQELYVTIDSSQLQQVLLNLFDNALDAAGAGGVITIRTGCLDDMAFIQIHDSGSGIPTDALAKIFESFFTTKDLGTGIGLAVCSSIMHGLGGSIQAYNAHKGGAVFELTLPLAQKSACQ